MNLSVAIGMDQDAVFCFVCATHRFVDDMVVVPACQTGDRLGTDRTVAALLFPKVGQGTSSLQGLFHLYAKALFQIGFPCRVVGVALSFDFRISGYGCCRGMTKPVFSSVSVFVFCCPEEMPVPISRPSKVAVGNPPFAFLRVPPSCPSPQGFEDGRVDMDKGFFSRSVSVKVRPSSYFGVELCYQPACCSLFVVLDDLSDACKKRFHVLFRRACEKLPVVLTYILSEKVKSVLNVRYPGFLFREFQSSFLEKFYNEWFDFYLQHLFRDASYNEVVRITYQVYLLVLAFERSPAGVWVRLAEYPFQAIQRHIGKDGRAYTSYKVANFLVEFSTSIPRTQLRPGYGDGFLGAPLQSGAPRDRPSPREQGGQRGTSSPHPQHNPGGAHHV